MLRVGCAPPLPDTSSLCPASKARAVPAAASGRWLELHSPLPPFKLCLLGNLSSCNRVALYWLAWISIEPSADALDMTVSWYKDVLTGKDARRKCLKQIENYKNCANGCDASS